MELGLFFTANSGKASYLTNRSVLIGQPALAGAETDFGLYVDTTNGSLITAAALLPSTETQRFNSSLPWAPQVSHNASLGPEHVHNVTVSSLLEASYLINEYYLWVVFAFGFPGNLATVITISRMRHFGSFVMYVALLAIADNLAIVVKILFYQLLLHRIPLGTAGCRILQFFGTVLASCCSWILVLMAIERLVAVRYPFKIHFQSCLTSRKTACIVIAVGLLISLLCLPILWAAYDNSRPGCQTMNTPLIQTIYWISITIYAFVPFIILALCNFLVAREIRLSFRLRNSFRSVHNFMVGRRSSDVPIQKQIMLMLFTATFMFILLHFPICMFLVVDTYWETSEGTANFEIKYLIQQLAYVLSDSNHAFNFYLYFLSARKFRAHFTHMLITCEKRHKCSKCAEEKYQLRRLHT